MTVIRHNSISGIVSITAAAGSNLSFYDSAGGTLSLDTGNINAGVITATTANFTNATVTGDLTVQGTTTTLDTTVTEVDKLEVGSNNTTVGVAITQSGTGDILRLYDGATQAVTVKDGGSVGIGTDNPERKIHVFNGTSGASSSNSNTGLILENSAASYLTFFTPNTVSPGLLFQDPEGASGQLTYSHSENAMLFSTAGSEALRITSTGRIDVNGGDLLFYNNSAADGAGNNITFQTDGGATKTAKATIFAQNDGASTYAGRLLINTTDSSGSEIERLRITSDGNIGINNAAPGTKLAIGDSTIDSSNVITFGKRIAGTNSNLPVIGHHSDGSGSGIAICATSSGGKIHFFTGNGSAGFGSESNAERMRIDHNGNVGIGLTTPSTKLDIYRSGSGVAARFGKETIWGEFQVDGQRIGIQGTRSSDSAITGFFVENPSSTGTSNFELVTIKTAGTERLRIDSSGRLLKSGQAALTSTSLTHPIQVASDSNANAIAIIGRAADDIGELSFYEADATTKLGELQYRQDHLNFRHRVGDIRFSTGGLNERLNIDSAGIFNYRAIASGSLNNSNWVNTSLTMNTSNGYVFAEIVAIGSENNRNNGFRRYMVLYNQFSGWGVTQMESYNVGNDYGLVDVQMNGTTVQVKAANNASNGAYRLFVHHYNYLA